MVKKDLIKTILTFLSLLIFIIFISSDSSKDKEVFGTVTFVSGNVNIIKFNSNESLNLKINTIILLGDTIETFKESKAEILLTDNKTRLIIMENTKVKLSSLINPENQKQTIISVFFGTINSIVQKLTGSYVYVIHTPNGSASVRGTEFSVSVSDTIDTAISVIEGTVSYQKEEDGQSFNINQNQYCISEIDTTPKISEGGFDNQSWLNDRNSQFEQNSQNKSAYIASNLINIVKTIATLIYSVKEFTENSLLYKLLARRLTPFDIVQFFAQKGGLLTRVYNLYYRLNLYDTIVLGFYRFFDFLSKYNDHFNEQKEKCWQAHLELYSWTNKVLEIYRAIWFFY